MIIKLVWLLTVSVPWRSADVAILCRTGNSSRRRKCSIISRLAAEACGCAGVVCQDPGFQRKESDTQSLENSETEEAFGVKYK